jgi:hypothetical protein
MPTPKKRKAVTDRVTWEKETVSTVVVIQTGRLVCSACYQVAGLPHRCHCAVPGVKRLCYGTCAGRLRPWHRGVRLAPNAPRRNYAPARATRRTAR